MSGMRFTLLCVCVLAAACNLDPEPEDVADDVVEVDEVMEEDEPAGVAYAGGGAQCVPQTCGIPGQGGNCGLIDDGCGQTLWCGACTCSSTALVCDTEAPLVTEKVYLLNPYQSFAAETNFLSAGADSVLHIQDTYTGAQLTYNDDYSGSVRSRVVYTNGAASKVIRLIVRAKSTATQGSAWLWVQQTGAWEPVGLGGRDHNVYLPQGGETVTSVKLPGDRSSAHVIYRFSPGTQSLVSRVASSASDSGAIMTMAAYGGTVRTMLGRTAGTGSGPARLIRNAGADSDTDGLSDQLEQTVGTCWHGSALVTKNGVTFDCWRASDPRDTDGDGLPDKWEIFGRRDVSPQVPLVMYGANPRHKDYFLEVDHSKSVPGGPAPQTPASTVETMAALFADTAHPLSPAQVSAHAASLRNPDGKRGVSVHVDIGIDDDLRSRFGNWGGSSVLEPVQDAEGNWWPRSGAVALATNFHPSRRGAFTYAVAHWGGGQFEGNSRTFVFAYSAGITLAHEAGHSVGMSHSGDDRPQVGANCKPNYVSLMNYAFDDVPFGDGTNGITLNNAAAFEYQAISPTTQPKLLAVLRDQFRYRVDETLGHVDWNRDGQFAPAGQAVRAYINNPPGGDCEYTNNMSTQIQGETTMRAPALVRYYGRFYILYAAPTTTRWRASTSSMNCPALSTGQCGTFEFNGSLALDSAGGVDAVRLTSNGEEMLVVARGGDNVLRWMLFDWIDGANAPVMAVSGALDGPAGSEPALVKDLDGTALLVFHDGSGALYQRTYSPTTRTWSAASTVVDSSGGQMIMDAGGSPALAVASYPRPGRAPTPLVYMLAAEPSHYPLFYYRDPEAGNRWTMNGGHYTQIGGRPAMAWVPDPADLAMGGRLHVVARVAGDPDKRTLIQLRSLVDQYGVTLIGHETQYFNGYLQSYGADLLYEPGVDTNLRAALTLSDGMPMAERRLVRFDPKADGINDFAYSDHDDWGRMSSAMCWHLKGGNTTFPLNCPTW